MPDNDVLLKGQDSAQTQFYPESEDLGNSVRRPMYGSSDGAQVTVGAKADAAWDGQSAAPSLISVMKAVATQLVKLNAAEAAYQGVTPMVAGTPLTAAGRAVRVNATTAGNVTLTYADGSTDTVPVNVGLSYITGAITAVAIPNSGGATATFASMK